VPSDDALTQAIQVADLPGLVAQLYPGSGAKPRTEGLYFAVWRGNENTPAFSIFRKENVWFWRDQATGDKGNAFHFLTSIHGLSPQEAAHLLLKRANIPLTKRETGRQGSRPKRRVAESIPVDVKVAKRHSGAPPVAIKALAKRGFNKEAVAFYGILKDGDDALIPITSPEGVVLAVKRRKARLRDDKDFKYVYETSGHGSPAWCSPAFHDSNVVVVVEGELNAMVGHYATREAGYSYAFMGVAGAANHLNVEALKGKTIYIYADDDDAGRKAQTRWAEDAHDAGAMAVKVMDRADKEQDFCYLAGEYGRTYLAKYIHELTGSATPVFTPMDRLIAGYRVQEFVDSAKRFMNGEVAHATGFPDIDLYTGGLPESGMVVIGALSSMGKSSLLRRFLLEEVIRGGKVRLYSPDQSPQSMFRLLAGAVSGVSPVEVRTGSFSAATVKRYRRDGMHEKDAIDAALAAWKDAYQWVVLDLSRRFQVVEEAQLGPIEKDAEQALDEGVTMLGGDYLQMFEPETSRGEKIEGKAADDFKRLARKWRVPMLFAAQLAKYKFGHDRHSGIPVGSDLLGASSIYNNSEQVYLIYNDYIYGRKYAGPKTQLLQEPADIAHIIVAKNKDGPSDDDFRVYWDGPLTLFLDPSETLDDFVRKVRGRR